MDEGTTKRMERKIEREHEVDCELQYIDYYVVPKIKLSLEEIINHVWSSAFNGAGREICKRKFISEVIDEKMKEAGLNVFE